MKKIDITQMKALEDKKSQLRDEVEKLKLKRKDLSEKILYPKLEETRNELFDAFDNYFLENGFEVSRRNSFNLIASYGGIQILVESENHLVRIFNNGKLVSEITISNKRNVGPRVSSSFVNPKQDPEIASLEQDLSRLNSDIMDIENLNIYFHVDKEIKQSLEEVLKSIFA